VAVVNEPEPMSVDLAADPSADSKVVPRWNKKQQYIVDSESFTSVKSLSISSSSDWVLKVKVIKKYERRTWTNSRGQGLLMNVDMQDATGSMI